MGLPVQPPPPYRSLAGLSDSDFHQTASPVPVVPRGGCPAYGRRQLAALAGCLRIYLPPDGKLRPVSSARRLSRIWEKTARRAAWSPLILPVWNGKPRKEQRGGCPAYGEKTARRVARYLRSLHIERACVRPFSASSVVFPRRLCNGGEHSSPCASPESPCRSARSPYRSLPGRLFAGTWCSGKVSPRGEARCSGASSSRILPENHSISASSDRMILLQSRSRPACAARKVGSPPVGSGRAPFGESFDLRRLRPNDSPPVVSAARPPRTRLVPLRFACSSNLLSVLRRRPGEQITEARLSLRSNPFGGFSFFQVASLP